MSAADRIELLRLHLGKGLDVPRPALRLLVDVAAAAARDENPGPELAAALARLGGAVKAGAA